MKARHISITKMCMLVRNRCAPMFILLLLITFSQAQDIGSGQRLDSLMAQVSNNKGLAKFDPMIEIVRYYAKLQSPEHAEGLKWAEQASLLARQAGDSAKIVFSARVTGQLLIRASRIREAELVLIPVLDLARRRGYVEDYLKILNNLALCYTFRAKYDSALKMHFTSLEMRKANGLLEEVCLSYWNIGLVFYKMRYYPKALEFYHRAIELSAQAVEFNPEEMFVNMGLCYNSLGKYDTAILYFDKAYYHCGSRCRDIVRMDAEFGLGIAKFFQRDYAKASEHFNQSYSISLKSDDRRFQAENLSFLGRILFAEKKYPQAVTTFKQAENLAVEGQYTELLIELYQSMPEVYSQINDYENMFHYQQKFISLNDSVHSDQLTINLMRLESEYIERENEMQLKSQAEALLLQEKIMTNQRLLNRLIGVVAVVLMSITILLVNRNKRKKEANRELDEKVKEYTRELQLSRDVLWRINQEMRVRIENITEDLREHFATMSGLCSIALKEIEEPKGRHVISKVERTSDQLMQTLGINANSVAKNDYRTNE